MAYKMTVQRTYDGLEGFKRKGDVIDVISKNRAEQLAKLGFATYRGAQGQDDKGIITVKPTERLDAAKTHAELDSFVKEFKLAGIPTKEDGANMDARRLAILAAL